MLFTSDLFVSFCCWEQVKEQEESIARLRKLLIASDDMQIAPVQTNKNAREVSVPKNYTGA